MSSETVDTNRRILVVDDNQAIHEDFRKILCDSGGSGDAALEEAGAALFDENPSQTTMTEAFEVDAASQGQQGLEFVQRAEQEGRPYAVAFVDIRMPPGWDGVETATRLWKESPGLQVVICTAYSDYSWNDMAERFGDADRWLILKKPFDSVEVGQLATSLTQKWDLARQASRQLEGLEEAVRERTRQLEKQNQNLEEALAKLQEAQAQLIQTDKMASIGQLAAGVAHEINNPIGFISSNLNTLGKYTADLQRVLEAHQRLLQECAQAQGSVAGHVQEVQKVCDEADLEFLLTDLEDLIQESVEGTKRVRQIVADLRDFSHVDSPDVTDEDLNLLIDKAINVAWNELKYKTEVVREYGEIPTLPCYGGKLGQVFLNLLVNAAHAIEKKGTVTIRTGVDGEMVWAEVSDTGCGMPADVLTRIFEPFFTTKDVGKGTGMGLHLAYKIVEAHAGRITATSEVGKGTTFRVELSLSGPPASDDEA